MIVATDPRESAAPSGAAACLRRDCGGSQETDRVPGRRRISWCASLIVPSHGHLGEDSNVGCTLGAASVVRRCGYG